MSELTTTDRESLSPERIRRHLEQVLASPHFRNSRRCQTLLHYVVEHALDGPLDALKERAIGHAVFDREAGYDTNQDAVVRNAAAEVRKRLAQYYMEAGPAADLRIELPSGSYLPEIHAPAPAAAAAEATPRPSAPFAIPWKFVAAALAILLAPAVWLANSRSGVRQPETELDRFWAPILTAPAAVQICVGQSRMAYLPKRPPETADPDAAIPLSSLVPMRDRFLWFGDALCLTRLTAYLSIRNKPYRVRGAAVTPYGELRGYPTVLIGAFNNEWTVRLTENLRFSLANGDTADVRGVHDREKGAGLAWHIKRSAQGWMGEEDYALVTRLFDPQTEHYVVAAGGISHYGTMATGDFLSNPVYFREALHSAPANWERKNMQVVLQTQIVEGTPGPPRILATHFW